MSTHENAPVLLQQDPGLTDGDQYSDSTAVQDVALLESLSKEQQELAVTRMLDQSKQWLERAMEATNPAREVSEFKAFVATVAEAAKQKKLSEGIQLDAVEMVRRAERALGVAIRKGQHAGEIAKPGDIGGIPPGAMTRSSNRLDLAKPTDFASPDELSKASYPMTDGVSAEEFEAVLTEAKSEGNMSRSNVVRKIKNLPTFSETQAAKWQTVADLAADRFTSAQIASRVGMNERSLRRIAKQRGITFPADEVIGKTRRIDGIDVLERIVSSIETDASVIGLIEFNDITPEQADEWLQRLAEPFRELTQLRKRLKEISHA